MMTIAPHKPMTVEEFDVWVLLPENIGKNASVFVPGKQVVQVGKDRVIDGGDVLPGFTLALKKIFKE